MSLTMSQANNPWPSESQQHEHTHTGAMGDTEFAQHERKTFREETPTTSDHDSEEFGDFESAPLPDPMPKAKLTDPFKEPVFFHPDHESDNLLTSDPNIDLGVPYYPDHSTLSTDDPLLEGQGLASPGYLQPDTTTRLARIFGKFPLRTRMQSVKRNGEVVMSQYEKGLTNGGGPVISNREAKGAFRIMRMKEEVRLAKEQAMQDDYSLRNRERLRQYEPEEMQKLMTELGVWSD